MQHPDEGQIHAWLDGELSLDEANELESHLGTCDECTARVAEARGLAAGASRIVWALDDVPAGVIPPAVAADGGDAAPVSALPLQRRRKRWWTRTSVHAAAAAILVVAVGLFVWPGRLNTPEKGLIAERALEDSIVAAAADSSPVMAMAEATSAPAVAPQPGMATAPGTAIEAGVATPRGTAGDARANLGAAGTGAAAPAGAVSGVTQRSAAETSAEGRGARDSVEVARLQAGFSDPSRPARPRADTALVAAPAAPVPIPQSRQVASRRERDSVRPAAGLDQAKALTAESRVATPPPAARLTTSGDVIRHALVGCFIPDSLAWSPALSESERALIPTFLQLDSLTATGGAGAGQGLVHLGPASLTARYDLRTWTPSGEQQGTITLRGAAGLLTIALNASGRGFAIFAKTGGETSRTTLVIARTSCR